MTLHERQERAREAQMLGLPEETLLVTEEHRGPWHAREDVTTHLVDYRASERLTGSLDEWCAAVLVCSGVVAAAVILIVLIVGGVLRALGVTGW